MDKQTLIDVVALAISDNHCTSVDCNCNRVHAEEAIDALVNAGFAITPAREQLQADLEHLLEPIGVEAYYCPDCQHPWGYHSEGRGCSMPVIVGTHIPKGRDDRPTEECKCAR